MSQSLEGGELYRELAVIKSVDESGEANVPEDTMEHSGRGDTKVRICMRETGEERREEGGPGFERLRFEVLEMGDDLFWRERRLMQRIPDLDIFHGEAPYPGAPGITRRVETEEGRVRLAAKRMSVTLARQCLTSVTA